MFFHATGVTSVGKSNLALSLKMGSDTIHVKQSTTEKDETIYDDFKYILNSNESSGEFYKISREITNDAT